LKPKKDQKNGQAVFLSAQTDVTVGCVWLFDCSCGEHTTEA
jgi:hypothetical protein